MGDEWCGLGELVGWLVVELSYSRNDPHASSKLRVFTKRLRLRPIELRFFLMGGLFDRTSIPTLLGATERIWKTQKISILRVNFRVNSIGFKPWNATLRQLLIHTCFYKTA